MLGVIIGIVDPDSIDPGEPLMMVLVFGPMGFLSGIVFALLPRVSRAPAGLLTLSPVSAAAWGFLGSVIAQVLYLGHGDAGLIANTQMATAFAAFGGLVAMVWLAIARKWRIMNG